MNLFSGKEMFPLPGDRRLVWDNHLEDNNLAVYDARDVEIWNMKSVIMHDDTCVGLTVGEHEFYFVTFNGLGVTMDVESLTVIQTQITK